MIGSSCQVVYKDRKIDTHIGVHTLHINNWELIIICWLDEYTQRECGQYSKQETSDFPKYIISLESRDNIRTL